MRRWHRRRRTRKKEYGRRVVCESVNFAFKQRLGRRLRTHGVHRQRRELGFRVLAYNANMVHRAITQRKIKGCYRRRGLLLPKILCYVTHLWLRYA